MATCSLWKKFHENGPVVLLSIWQLDSVFFAQKEPTTALCNGKLCCPLLFYFLLMSQSEQAQLFP